LDSEPLLSAKPALVHVPLQPGDPPAPPDLASILAPQDNPAARHSRRRHGNPADRALELAHGAVEPAGDLIPNINQGLKAAVG
jgi:hypothetical protein